MTAEINTAVSGHGLLCAMPANLTVHMSALRRTLRDGRDGNRFIINVPGRGYSFVASVAVAGRANQMATRPRRAVRATLSTVRRRLVGVGSAVLKRCCKSSDGNSKWTWR